MKQRAALYLLAAAVALLITWKIPISSVDVQEKARNILDSNYIDQIKEKFKAALDETAPAPKCGLSAACPRRHFALRLTSGGANVAGPQICFEGKTIMSHVLNNVAPGLNVVVINGENGVVETFGSVNKRKGKGKRREEEGEKEGEEDILAYLKGIRPGMIVLVASFGDVVPVLTREVRELLARMGSALIKSLKARDNWVFAGRTGSTNRSLFEKAAVNDAETNPYEGWPGQVEVGGCFPRAVAEETPTSEEEGGRETSVSAEQE